MTAVVQCRRVDEIADPVPGSVPVACTGCAVPVWFHPVDSRLGDVAVYCATCVPRVGPIMFSPGQIDALHATGLDDDGIARMLAIARMTAGNADAVPALVERLAADPGVRRRFDEAIITAAVDLAEVYP